MTMKSENTIWIVLDSRSIGGIESHVLELAGGLDELGLQSCVVFIENHGQHPLRSALQASGIATFALDGKLATLLHRMRRDRPGVVHSHGYKAGLWCCLASRLSGVPHVSTFHSGDPGTGRVALYDWLHRQAARFTDLNLAVSAEIARRVPARTRIINNFVTPPDPTPQTAAKLAFVGRLSVEKGPDLLLSVARQLAPVRFDVYGDGPMMESLCSTAPANCHFHGNQADMAPHWREIDLLLIPSRHEGLPMAALEAMARGIPVIGFDVGNLNRLVTSGENGWLVPGGDVKAFRVAIEHWLDLGGQQKQAVRDAARRQVVDRFSTGRVVPLIAEHYRLAAGLRFPVCDAICE